MRNRTAYSLIRWLSIALIVLSVFFLTVQLVQYSQIRSNFPSGLSIAGVPVGALNLTQASERLLSVYSTPVELRYGTARIQVRPAILGFELQLEAMLAAADIQRTEESFWVGFWNYLWNNPQTSTDVPLQAKINENLIKDYLNLEISPRYDQPATPPMPISGEIGFYPGIQGTELDIERAVLQVKQALSSSSNRAVSLPYQRTSMSRASFELVETMIKGIIDESGFDGIVEIFLHDLESSQTLNFVYGKLLEEEIPTNIAYSSWSTIKIPVMVSAFKVLQEPYSEEDLQLIEEMIEQSENSSTDQLAMTVIDRNLGPLMVTEDLMTLGFQNTFWAGYFYEGAPRLDNFETPANQRTDYDTEPDLYAQTTPMDMGLLLKDIYHCSEYGGGSLIPAFNGAITQNECKLMIQYLSLNKIGVLIQAGVPAGITVAHKHGWAYEFDDGYIHTIGDAGIVYTPGGDYVLSIFAYHPVQAIFDPVNMLVANISSGIYNYFNLQ